MIFKDKIPNWIGQYEIVVTKKDGTVEKELLDNIITDDGLQFLSEVIAGEQSSGKYLYLGIGTGTALPSSGDSQLVNELERVPFRDYTFPSNGVARQRALIRDTEGVFHIKELGVFAGDSATEDVNTGVLVSRVLYERDKTNLETIQVTRIDTFNRGGN